MVLTSSQEEEYLLRYEQIVCGFMKTYYLRGAEKVDLFQVGKIGLLSAIRSYSGIYTKSTDPSFVAFAKTVVGRTIISAVKEYNRQKQRHLNDRCHPIPDGEDEADLSELPACADERYNPERLFMERREANDSYLMLPNGERLPIEILSEFERQVLLLRAGLLGEDRTYNWIAKRLNVAPKAVDNALGRIKRKLRPALARRTTSDNRTHIAA